MRRFPACASLLLVALAATLAITLSTSWSAPYRYDGAGYAVLARAIMQGAGYRAIDHPDEPYHAHFPPGYPIALALIGKCAGSDLRIVHLFSAICSVAATLAAYRWFARLFGERVGLALGLALAANWAWVRAGGGIQSEPLFMFLGQSAILVSDRVRQSKNARSAFGLGILLGAALLTRHVAIALIVAILADLALSRCWRNLVIVALTTFTVAIPWIVWMIWVAAQVQGTNQAALLMAGEGGGIARVVGQLLFYAQRIPDQLIGPFVEVATVFRKSATTSQIANAWGIAASLIILVGWLCLLNRPRRRLAGLIPLVTMGLLLAWPFTEAGRFLIPLIPCLLIGAMEGMASTLGRILLSVSKNHLRRNVAILLLASSIPYTFYGLTRNLMRGRDSGQESFDAACAWIAKLDRQRHPGPILTRHPGEVFLLTGRQALDVSTSERAGTRDATPEEVAATISRYKVAYLLVDNGRYANAPITPLARFVEANPRSLRKVWFSEPDAGTVSIYEVIKDQREPMNSSEP